jgi:hypothetical protein
MKSMLRMVCTALVAALALAAVASASALASPEWHVRKKGTWSKVTTSVAVAPEAVKVGLALGKEKEGFRCTSTHSEGSIEAAGAGQLTRFPAVEEPGSHCEDVKGAGLNGCSKVDSITEGSLPWHTELYAEGSEIRAHLVGHAGGGVPSLRVECEGLLGRFTFECSGVTSLHMANNGTAGVVEGTFDSKSAKVKCVGGGGEPGEWLGTIKVKPTAKEVTNGIEAIKVE